MLKKTIIILLTLCNFIIYTTNILDANERISDDVNDIYYKTGLDDLISKYSDNDIAENINNIFNEDLMKEKSKFLSFSPLKMINFIMESIKQEIKQPLKIVMGILSIVLVAAVIQALKICFSSYNVEEIVNCVCVLGVFIYISQPLIDCVKSGINAIVNMSNFMISFIPIYSGIMSSSGMALTGGVYNTFLFFICQIVSEIISCKILPVMGIYMSFCLVGSIAPNLNIDQAAKAIKNIITWILGFMVTAFVGLITVQGVVACSADTVGTKAAKFLIGSAVPIIGSVISDAYTSVKGCFDFVRSGVGAISIVFIVISFLPILIKLTIWVLTTKFSSAIADFIGVKEVSEILKSSSYVISLLFAIIISYVLLIVTAMTIMLILGLGLH